MDQGCNQEGNFRMPVRCFRCKEGCVHLEYGNIVFTFTTEQFTVLANVIGKVQQEIVEAEMPKSIETKEEDLSDWPTTLIM